MVMAPADITDTVARPNPTKQRRISILGASPEKNGRRGFTPRRPFSYRKRLERFQICRLHAACVRLRVERHALAFGEAAQSGRLDGGRMDEHVLAAAFRLNETVTLS
jgi:hypothetical protein